MTKSVLKYFSYQRGISGRNERVNNLLWKCALLCLKILEKSVSKSYRGSEAGRPFGSEMAQWTAIKLQSVAQVDFLASLCRRFIGSFLPWWKKLEIAKTSRPLFRAPRLLSIDKIPSLSSNLRWWIELHNRKLASDERTVRCPGGGGGNFEFSALPFSQFHSSCFSLARHLWARSDFAILKMFFKRKKYRHA